MSDSRKSLTMVGCDYLDRTHFLAAGEIQPEGIDLRYETMGIAEMFRQMAQDAPFDAGEMSFSTFMMLTSRGGCSGAQNVWVNGYWVRNVLPAPRSDLQRAHMTVPAGARFSNSVVASAGGRSPAPPATSRTPIRGGDPAAAQIEYERRSSPRRKSSSRMS